MNTAGKKIVMCGCLESGWEVIKDLLEAGIKISWFVTITPGKAKKAMVSGYADFTDLAKQYSIPVYYANKYSLNSEEDIEFFRKHKFDLLLQGGWQRLFHDIILSTLRVGAVGGHGSSEFLPKGRGRSPINWSIIEGKKRFIFHYFLIKPGIDNGDIFHYEMVDINEWDTCRTIYYKNSIVTKRVLKKWIPLLLEGKFTLFPQIGEPSYYLKRTPDDGRIDWSLGVYEIYKFISALTHPYPGAFSHIDDSKIIFWEARPFDTRISYIGIEEGTIVELFRTGDFVINCNSGLLLVSSYEFEGNIRVGQKLV